MMLFALQEHFQEHAATRVAQEFNAGETIIEHVSNSGLDHPLIPLWKLGGIDFSVTKHVLMLWLVSTIIFVGVSWTVRRYLKQDRLVPSGFTSALELLVEFIRDSVVLPNVGKRWVNVWTPLILTLFVFIFSANAIGIIPMFEVLGLLDRFVLHTAAGSFVGRIIHGGATATGNFNVTGGLAVVTFGAIIVAGTRAHGFVAHWKNIVPHGLHWSIYILLIPIEVMGMFVKPFALTVRLAANMTGGHIAILAILSIVFIFTEQFGHAAGFGAGALSVPLAAAISGLEIIVVVVQAYVFTFLTAVFIGMAIHVHH